MIDRNVLEWRLDPQSDQIPGYDTRIVIVCNEGYSSRLGAAPLQELGLHCATNLIGGFQAWLTVDPEQRAPVMARSLRKP